MNYTSAQLKNMAKDRLRGNFPNAILVGIIISVASSAITYILNLIVGIDTGIIFSSYMNSNSCADIDIGTMLGLYSRIFFLSIVVTLISSIIISILEAGRIKFHLNLARRQEGSISDIAFGFSNHPIKYFGLSLLATIIPTLCTIPGFIFLFVGIFTNNAGFLALYTLLMLAGSVGSVIVSLMISLSLYLLVDNPEKGVFDVIKESIHLMNGNKGRLFYIGLSFIGWSFLCIFTCCIGYLWLVPYIDQTIALFYLDVTGQLTDSNPNSWGGQSFNNGNYTNSNQFNNGNFSNNNQFNNGNFSNSNQVNNGNFPNGNQVNNGNYPNGNQVNNGNYPNSNQVNNGNYPNSNQVNNGNYPNSNQVNNGNFPNNQASNGNSSNQEQDGNN
jgi:uncharacterized membrane protein